MSGLADLHARVEALEAERAVRHVLMRYFAFCDDLGPHTPLDEVGALFTRDARWEGRGRYEAAFGVYEGRDAIVRMIAAYCDPPHFAMTAHFLTSERIEVSGGAAWGTWLMLQYSTYADGRSDLRSAALDVHFSIEDGLWCIARFRTTNIFSKRVEGWSDEAAIPVPEAVAEGARHAAH